LHRRTRSASVRRHRRIRTEFLSVPAAVRRRAQWVRLAYSPTSARRAVSGLAHLRRSAGIRGVVRAQRAQRAGASSDGLSEGFYLVATGNIAVASRRRRARTRSRFRTRRTDRTPARRLSQPRLGGLPAMNPRRSSLRGRGRRDFRAAAAGRETGVRQRHRSQRSAGATCHRADLRQRLEVRDGEVRVERDAVHSGKLGQAARRLL